MSSTVALKWIDSQPLAGVDSFGYPIVIGSWPEKDPQSAGLKSSDLLLLSAAACSTYDIVQILAKQHETLDGLEVQCTGEQEPDPPYRFTKIHLHDKVFGEVNLPKLERAIHLSEEKYGSVLNTLKPTVQITSDYELA
jgi:putative redox protein